jgi:hypothetical protein
MNDIVGRMVWALPLVLGLGVFAIVAIKRVLDRLGVAPTVEPMRLAQSLNVSDGMRAHLLTVGSNWVLIFESSAAPVVQVLPTTAALRASPGFRSRKHR